MIETIDAAIQRLKADEVWPFLDFSSGMKIQENLFYGFGDSGSMWAEDHSTADECIKEIRKVFDDSYLGNIGTTPEELGDAAVTVLSGRQFIDQLYYLCDYNKGNLDEYGQWSKPEQS
jgi:hypothetical protein